MKREITVLNSMRFIKYYKMGANRIKYLVDGFGEFFFVMHRTEQDELLFHLAHILDEFCNLHLAFHSVSSVLLW